MLGGNSLSFRLGSRQTLLSFFNKTSTSNIISFLQIHMASRIQDKFSTSSLTYNSYIEQTR
ncbi:uncharacterized protein B0P05DRAFT_524129 [Gilbertella persicaria]|uniref:uncharacterized protein n=1 Tax=Gilbertella persicaria TaxID=101096 RepID=UPI00221F837A|nr:uncharacterized protein B0P05DRAFT_524129 [Gilbertella persicaria]KAI8094966.1 hypothetical protein B0P05DRAFT_524129 [Gilbertella persicaria]